MNQVNQPTQKAKTDPYKGVARACLNSTADAARNKVSICSYFYLQTEYLLQPEINFSSSHQLAFDLTLADSSFA